MREKIIRTIVETAFILRYWVILILLGALVALTVYVSHLPDIQIRDIVAVFTGGSVVITIFYHVLNYEYSQRRFKHDLKTSKELQTFNIAMEWQKEYMSRHNRSLYKFYLNNKKLLENNRLQKLQEKLDLPENEEYYDSLFTVLNFLESIGLGIRQGMMDEKFLEGFFGTVFANNYSRWNAYIEFRRKQKQNKKIWQNFTEIAEDWANSKK